MRIFCIALILYIIVISVILIIKPDIVYNKKTKQYRPFGTGPESTLLPIWLVALLFAVVSYILSTILVSIPAISTMLPFSTLAAASSQQQTPASSSFISAPASNTSSFYSKTPPSQSSPIPIHSSKHNVSSTPLASYTQSLPEAPPLYEFRTAHSPYESIQERLQRQAEPNMSTFVEVPQYEEDYPGQSMPYHQDHGEWPSISEQRGSEYRMEPNPQNMSYMPAYGGGRRTYSEGRRAGVVDVRTVNPNKRRPHLVRSRVWKRR